MACAWRQSGRKRWVIQWTDELGKRRQKVTWAETKREALKMALELERKAERIRLGLDEAAPPPVAAEEFFERYLSEVASLLRDPATIRWTVEKHIVPAFKGRPLASIGPADAQRWVSALAKSGLAPVTQKNVRVRFSAALNVARRWGYIRTNPLEHVRGVRVPPREPTFLELEEITALLSHVPSEWKVCVMVAIATGLRRGELFGLRKSWIDFSRQAIRVLGSYDDGSTKSNKARTVPIPDDLLPLLKAHVESVSGDLVFPRPGGTMYGPNFEPSILLNEWAKAAGIKKKLRWHDLRATFATHANAHADSRFAQAVLGHSSIQITERYLGLSKDRLNSAGRGLRLVSGAARAPITDSGNEPASSKTSTKPKE